MTTTASPEGDGWRIQGEKWFIGNGGQSSFYVVFAKEADGRADRPPISAFIVDAKAEGVVVDEWVDKMGIRGTSTSNLRLDTVVGPDARLGAGGRGLRLALGTLTVGRIATAAQCVGLARGAFEAAASRASQRHQFGQPIIDNQGISFPLASVATELSAARMMMYEAARWYDADRDTSSLGPMAKLYASEVAHRAVDVAVQVFGGYGYCKPNKVERFYRDQRVFEIVEGTSEVQRLVIGRAIRAAAMVPGS